MFSAKALKSHWVLMQLCMIVSLTMGNAVAQGTPSARAAEELATTIHTAPVVVDGMTLFSVRGVSAYPAEKRAEEIADRIRTVAANHDYSPQWLQSREVPLGTQLVADAQPIMTLFDSDARLEGVRRQVLAQAYLQKVTKAIDTFRHDREPKLLIWHSAYAIAAMFAFALMVWVGRRIITRIRFALERRYREKIHGVQIQAFHILRAEHIWHLLTGTLSFLWVCILFAAAYLDLHYVLSLFPWTRGFANGLSALLLNPLATMAASLLDALPDLIFLAILVVITFYLLKLIRLFFSGVETGAITISGFEPVWAKPTYRLVRVAVIAFALVAAYPYIPGSNSQAFKGVSLLIGVIFSLGSTSLIGNIISGYSMTYRRVFKEGDRVRIGDHIGDVQATKLMVTYLRTPKNELIAVPNSVIINGEVVNYSALSQKEGLILHTTVGIGYETSWRQVEAMLLQAAQLTPGLLLEPKPFVLQKELGDFAITYEINVYCDAPRAMDHLYTALHRNILDVFNEYGIQIMTPAYEGDPEQAKVVPKEQWYSAPARRADSDDATGSKDKAVAA